jgi:hypothetical protein
MRRLLPGAAPQVVFFCQFRPSIFPPLAQLPQRPQRHLYPASAVGFIRDVAERGTRRIHVGHVEIHAVRGIKRLATMLVYTRSGLPSSFDSAASDSFRYTWIVLAEGKEPSSGTVQGGVLRELNTDEDFPRFPHYKDWLLHVVRVVP